MLLDHMRCTFAGIERTRLCMIPASHGLYSKLSSRSGRKKVSETSLTISFTRIPFARALGPFSQPQTVVLGLNVEKSKFCKGMGIVERLGNMPLSIFQLLLFQAT